MHSLNLNAVKSLPLNKYWSNVSVIGPFWGTPLEITLVNEGIEALVCIVQLNVNWYDTTDKMMPWLLSSWGLQVV